MERGSSIMHRVLGDVRDHGDDVGFLVSELAQASDPLRAHAGFALDLAGNDEHGNGVGPRPKNSIERVDAAGPGGDVDHAGQAADAGVGFGGHRGSLFMVIANVAGCAAPLPMESLRCMAPPPVTRKMWRTPQSASWPTM